LEWLLYFLIELALISFFIVSIYNVSQVYTHNSANELKEGLHIANACVLIFIGFFVGMIYYNGKISKLQICFCGHITPFLILTGIAVVVSVSKQMESNLQLK
jgi:hypothetical protein